MFLVATPGGRGAVLLASGGQGPGRLLSSPRRPRGPTPACKRCSLKQPTVSTYYALHITLDPEDARISPLTSKHINQSFRLLSEVTEVKQEEVAA